MQQGGLTASASELLNSALSYFGASFFTYTNVRIDHLVNQFFGS